MGEGEGVEQGRDKGGGKWHRGLKGCIGGGWITMVVDGADTRSRAGVSPCGVNIKPSSLHSGVEYK